jgi:hypothetical protein
LGNGSCLIPWKVSVISHARVPPNTDQRQVYVTLTVSGTQALQLADQVLLARISALVEQLKQAGKIHLTKAYHTACTTKLSFPTSETSSAVSSFHFSGTDHAILLLNQH